MEFAYYDIVPITEIPTGRIIAGYISNDEPRKLLPRPVVFVDAEGNIIDSILAKELTSGTIRQVVADWIALVPVR